MQGNQGDQLLDLYACMKLLEQAANGKTPLGQSLSRLLHIICGRLGAQVVEGWLKISTLNSQRLAYHCSRGTASGTRSTRVSFAEVERGLIPLVEKANKTVQLNDVDVEAPGDYIRWGSPPSGMIMSELAVPIRFAGQPIGVVDVGSTQLKAFSKADRVWLEHIVGLLATLVVRHSLDREIEAGADPIPVLDAVLRVALKASGLADAEAWALICDKNRVVPVRGLRLLQGAYSSPSPPASEWSISRGIIGKAISEGKEQVDGNLRRDGSPFSGWPIQDLPMRSHAAFPVRRGQDIVGVLYLRTARQRVFGKAAVQALQILVKQVGLISFVAQLSGMLSREQAVFEQLAEVKPAEIAARKLEAVYATVVQTAFQLLPAVNAAHLLTVEDVPVHATVPRLEMQYADASPQSPPEGTMPWRGKCPDDYEHRWIRFGDGVTGEAAENRRPVYVSNVVTERDPGKTYIVLLESTRTEFAIPLVLGSNVIGVLNLESEQEDALSKRDRAVARLLATQAAFAITSARNYLRTVQVLRQAIDALGGVMDAIARDDLIDAILKWALRVAHAEEHGFVQLTLYDGAGSVKTFRRGTPPPSPRLPEQGPTQTLLVRLEDVAGKPVGDLVLDAPPWERPEPPTAAALETCGPLVRAALSTNRSIHDSQERAQRLIHDSQERAQRLRGLLSQFLHLLNKKLPQDYAQALDYLRLLVEWHSVRESALANNSEPSLQSLEVSQLVSEVCGAFRWYVEQEGRNIELVDETRSGEPQFILASKGDAQVALFELLDNALKFSPPGSTIVIRIQPLGGGRYIEIAVEDEGPGVPPEDRERIWRERERGTNAHLVGGTGLGLYCVRSTMERLEGDSRVTWLHPRLKRGSMFLLRFRVGPVRNPAHTVS